MSFLQCLLFQIAAIQGLMVCDSGWEYYQSNCYYFSDDEVDHDGALKYCDIHGTALATIINQDELDFITIVTKTSALRCNKYFVHGYCHGECTGSDFTDVFGNPVPFVNWKIGQPSDPKQNCIALVLERCVSGGFNLTRRQMADRDCSKPLHYICKKIDGINQNTNDDTATTGTAISLTGASETEDTMTMTNGSFELGSTFQQTTFNTTGQINEMTSALTSGIDVATATSSVEETSFAATTMPPNIKTHRTSSPQATETEQSITTNKAYILNVTKLKTGDEETTTLNKVMTTNKSFEFGSTFEQTTFITMGHMNDRTNASTSVIDVTTATSAVEETSFVAKTMPPDIKTHRTSSPQATETKQSMTTNKAYILNGTKLKTGDEDKLNYRVQKFIPTNHEAPGSVALGVMGIVILCTILGCIVLSDFPMIRKHFRYMMYNLGRNVPATQEV